MLLYPPSPGQPVSLKFQLVRCARNVSWMTRACRPLYLQWNDDRYSCLYYSHDTIECQPGRPCKSNELYVSSINTQKRRVKSIIYGPPQGSQVSPSLFAGRSDMTVAAAITSNHFPFLVKSYSGTTIGWDDCLDSRAERCAPCGAPCNAWTFMGAVIYNIIWDCGLWIKDMMDRYMINAKST